MKQALLSVAVIALVASPAAAQTAPVAPEKPAPVPAASPTSPGETAPGAPVPGIGGRTSAPALAPKVYDESADAKADVAAAVAKARKEKKRVLVTLGANWCGWCRLLDRLFTQDEKVSAELSRAYVPVKVDVGRMTKNLDLAASWGADPKKGVPLLVVLDGKGKAVKVQDTAALEAGKGYDVEKVVAFLKETAGR